MNFDKNLIGIDQLNTAYAYYDRDCKMHLNSNNNIRKSLKKLGYYNLNKDNEDKKLYINTLSKKINELDDNWKSTIKDKTINDFLPYNDANESLMNRFERSRVLSKHLDKKDTLEFYNDLTLEELEYLGY